MDNNVNGVEEVEIPKCTALFERMYNCITPKNQAIHIYLTGEQDDCHKKGGAWITCLTTRSEDRKKTIMEMNAAKPMNNIFRYKESPSWGSSSDLE